MARPKVSVRRPWSTAPSRTGGLQTLLVQVKTEKNCSPALGEKLLPEPPISATLSSTFLGVEGLQATVPAMLPIRQPADDNSWFASPGRPSIFDFLQEIDLSLVGEETKQNRNPASASISTAAVVKVEGINAEGERKTSSVGKNPRAGRFQLSFEDLVSDANMRLEDKANKLGVSITLLKNRRKEAGLGRWLGRQVRAHLKRAKAQECNGLKVLVFPDCH